MSNQYVRNSSCINLYWNETVSSLPFIDTWKNGFGFPWYYPISHPAIVQCIYTIYFVVKYILTSTSYLSTKDNCIRRTTWSNISWTLSRYNWRTTVVRNRFSKGFFLTSELLSTSTWSSQACKLYTRQLMRNKGNVSTHNEHKEAHIHPKLKFYFHE